MENLETREKSCSVSSRTNTHTHTHTHTHGPLFNIVMVTRSLGLNSRLDPVAIVHSVLSHFVVE